MLPFAVAFFLASLCSSAIAAEGAGTIDEFPLSWPSEARNSTHELTYDHQGGKVFWVTGQNQDQIARVALDGTRQVFNLPKGSGPHGLSFDGQGRLWVSLEFAGQIVRVDDNGTVAETIDVRLRTAGTPAPLNPYPHGIAFGPDGRTLWFTGKQTATIGKVDPDHSVHHFPLSTVGAVPIYLTSGPDGNIWGTELVGNKIVRIRPDGQITEFPIPTAGSRPIAIVPGPDGRSLWFSQEASNQVARIDLEGQITEYPVPRVQTTALLAGLAFDHDGDLWTQMYASDPASESDKDYIVRIDRAIATAPAGDLSRLGITYFQTPSVHTMMHRITEGPDGNIWFTEMMGDRLGRVINSVPAGKR